MRAAGVAATMGLEIALVLSASAEPPTVPHWIPADILRSDHLLADEISAPAGIEHTLLILCETHVTTRGSLVDTHCYGEANEQTHAAHEIARAAGHARATPATLDGTPMRVWVPFSVNFQPATSGLPVSVLPNQRVALRDGSFDYTAPQRFHTPSRTRCKSWSIPPTLLVYRVSSGGFVVDVATNATRFTDACIGQYFRGMRFIPAQRDGQPFDAVVRQYLFPSMRW